MNRHWGLGEVVLGLALVLLPAAPCLAQPATSQTLSPEQSFEVRGQAFVRELPALMQAWREAKDPAVKKELVGEVYGGIRYHNIDDGEEPVSAAVEEIVAGGPVAEKVVQIGQTAREFRLKPLKVFAEIGDPLARTDRGYPVWVDRRITHDALEVWSSKDGWLFDGKGKLLNHATVPRRDGTGLQWFGAFLPDGQWVTTDLWSYDQTLFLFSKDGQFVRDLPMADLVHVEPGGEAALIGWARSDKDGKGWVVDGFFWTGPDLKPRTLASIEEWKLCMPRQLGVRYLTVPSDDGQLLLTGYEAGHGSEVGYPTYYLNRYDAAMPLSSYDSAQMPGKLWEIRVPGHACNIGFWPGSHRAYVYGGIWGYGEPRIWFLDEAGKCLGWLHGKRLADAADGKGMLFKMPDDLIVNIGNDQKCREVRNYVGAGGQTAAAYALYDDLKMGLFVEDGKLELCAWETAGNVQP